MVRRLLVAAIACALNIPGGVFAATASVAQGSDAEITDRVMHKLLEDDSDVAQRIHVSTVNGVVTLEGKLTTNSQVLKVLGDAQTVAGVTRVKNRLFARM